MKATPIASTTSREAWVGVMHLTDETILPYLVTQLDPDLFRDEETRSILLADAAPTLLPEVLFADPLAMRFATKEEALAAYEMREAMRAGYHHRGDPRLARLCEKCHEPFCPSHDETTVCFDCSHQTMFEVIEEEYPDVLGPLRSLYGEAISVEHTGGGCMAILMDLGGGHYLLLTDLAGPLGGRGHRAELEGWAVGAYDGTKGEQIGITDPDDPFSMVTTTDTSAAAGVAAVTAAVKLLDPQLHQQAYEERVQQIMEENSDQPGFDRASAEAAIASEDNS